MSRGWHIRWEYIFIKIYWFIDQNSSRAENEEWPKKYVHNQETLKKNPEFRIVREVMPNCVQGRCGFRRQQCASSRARGSSTILQTLGDPNLFSGGGGGGGSKEWSLYKPTRYLNWCQTKPNLRAKSNHFCELQQPSFILSLRQDHPKKTMIWVTVSQIFTHISLKNVATY